MHHHLINSSKSLRPTPPPTTRPCPVCVGLGLTVESAPLEAAEARHGGDSCVLWEFLGSRQNLSFSLGAGSDAASVTP